MMTHQVSHALSTSQTRGNALPYISQPGLTRNLQEQTIPVIETKSFEICLTKAELPLTVLFDDQTYILVLTKSNKLLLQKPNNQQNQPRNASLAEL